MVAYEDVPTPDAMPDAMPDARTAPMTATPRVWPICRLVEATAAATPACARGMPGDGGVGDGGVDEAEAEAEEDVADEAAVTFDVSASNAANSTPLAVIAMPATSSGSRGAAAADERPESGAHTRVMAAIGSIHRPASRALRPRTFCR